MDGKQPTSLLRYCDSMGMELMSGCNRYEPRPTDIEGVTSFCVKYASVRKRLSRKGNLRFKTKKELLKSRLEKIL